MKYLSNWPVPLLFVVAVLCFSACASSSVSTDEITQSIPETAFEIHLYSDQAPQDYLGYIRRRLEMRGFEVLRYSAVDQNLATASSDVGRQISLAIFVTVTTDRNVSKTRAVFSGIQGRDQDMVGAARWSSVSDDQAYAFGRLAEIVNGIDHDNLVYAVAEQ